MLARAPLRVDPGRRPDRSDLRQRNAPMAARRAVPKDGREAPPTESRRSMLTLRRLRAFGPAVSAFALALAGCTAGVSDASSSADPDGLVVTPPTWTIPPLLEHDPFTVP